MTEKDIRDAFEAMWSHFDKSEEPTNEEVKKLVDAICQTCVDVRRLAEIANKSRPLD